LAIIFQLHNQQTTQVCVVVCVCVCVFAKLKQDVLSLLSMPY